MWPAEQVAVAPLAADAAAVPTRAPRPHSTPCRGRGRRRDIHTGPGGCCLGAALLVEPPLTCAHPLDRLQRCNVASLRTAKRLLLALHSHRPHLATCRALQLKHRDLSGREVASQYHADSEGDEEEEEGEEGGEEEDEEYEEQGDESQPNEDY